MNTPNNKRRRESQKRIITAFVRLLQEREINEISVTEICSAANVNRTTFYANYVDIYALADAVQRELENEVFDLYRENGNHNYSSDNFLKLFYHIKENPIFYKTYFKLDTDGRFRLAEYDIGQAAAYYGNRNIEYHIEFFRSGLNAVIKKWLANDCRESPEEIQEIIMQEYSGKKIQ